MQNINRSTLTPEAQAASPRSRATFFGTAYHKVSGRNQVAIPRHLLRAQEEAREGQFLLVRWNEEGFLRLYTQAQLDTIIDEIRNSTEISAEVKPATIRHLAGSAEPVEPDSQGRFVLPAPWVEALGLREEVAFCGAFSRIEIWPAAARRDRESQERSEVAAAAKAITGILDQ